MERRNSMFNNNLITIYDKPATYKSSLGVSLLSSSNKKSCYINLEGNKHIPISMTLLYIMI